MQYSIVNKNDLDNIAFRFDAEFYNPKHIKLSTAIKSKSNILLKDANIKIDCSAFYPSIVPYYNFNKSGIPFLRVNEIQNGLLNISVDSVFLPNSILDENKSTIAKTYFEDIIIAKGGNTLGKVALITNDYSEYSICRDLIVLKTKDILNLNKYYLWIFLHSEIGQSILLRTASQTGQPHLTVEAIYNLTIPLFSRNFQNIFENIYKKIIFIKNESLKYYDFSKDFLLKELNLLDLKPKHKLSFIKNYSDTEEAGRIDAEYFQPKYNEIIDKIKNYKNGFESLGNIFKLNDKNYNPDDETEYNYIELANVSSNGDIKDITIDKGKNLPTRARRKVNKDDVILSSIEGSLSCISLINESLNNALCSTGFYVLKPDSINSETLFMMMKLNQFQALLKKGCSGTILTSISKDELKKIPIPKVDIKIQNEIKVNIKKSNDCIFKSKALLEIAKKGVEMAIEQDEEKAEKWIKEEVEKLGVKIDA